MTDKQPEALSIAKRLKDQQQPLSLALRHKAAAELRRLHEVNAELVEALREAADEIDSWGSYASDYFRIKHDLAGSIRKVYAVIDRATEPQQPKDTPVWYFMRDNHTFRKLTGSVESMLAAITEEISAGYKSGSVFCRELKIDIHCDYENTAAFTEECRAVITKATGEQQ